MRPRHALIGALLAAAISCTGNDPVLLAHLHVETGSLTRCVVVVANNQDGGRDMSLPRRVDAGESLRVGIFRGNLSNQVMVQAQGFESVTCTFPPGELSEVQTKTFTPGAVPEFDLTLRGEGSCSDGRDGDGDGLTDCQDGACFGDPACAPDAGDGGPPGPAFSYPPSNFSPGALAVPDAGLIIDCDAGYDTGTRSGFLCGAPNPPSYVLDGGAAGPMVLLAVSSLTITPTGQWNISGPSPLIVAVFGDAGIYGPLLGGAAGGKDGPGVRRTGCPGLGYEGQDGGSGGGGGGGAGYGRPGAHGSVSAGGLGPPAAGGDGGLAFGTPELVPLRAGCPGGQGGVQSTVEPLGSGGGGGAIQLSAAGILQVTSAIGVPGGGGRGATVPSNNGGGGGGSGGAILLEGRQLLFAGSARVTANGGAGGEGSNGTTSLNGADGRSDGDFPAAGGDGITGVPGGDGGAGAVDATPAADFTGTDFGGGGGGGAVGRIRLNAAQSCVFESFADQVLSPPATSNRAGDAGCP